MTITPKKPYRSVIMMRANAKKNEDKPYDKYLTMFYCSNCDVEAAYPDNSIYCTICRKEMRVA